ncbi:receptor-like protein kinase FERONIA [Lotus japonicus]|uniref:receptor-like protein kinase FERONIA n=1 Tax=Lotus japonicus TaxID=34305 RepID=UPI00258E175C|nr:receptor-like protein kinase FERONIA [Lotus japonicus]
MMRLTPTFLYFSLSLVTLSTYLQAYLRVDHFTISCGYSGYDYSFDGERTWAVDTDSKILSPQHISTIVTASANTLGPSINRIPYSTARLSRSQFNYSFPVITPGPKFLRLFFYPASYNRGSFNREDTSFTVESNGFTLLKDFNASLTADAEGLDTIFKEYTINVNDGESPDLTLTPTTSSSYAFINGIEVLSMPSDLYYTPSTNPGFKLVGYQDSALYSAITSTTLETSYRIKVGVQSISPSKDTGLFRTWEAKDDFYLRTPSALDTIPLDLTGTMNITVSPDYAAPKDLYRTTRDMGLNKTLNKMLNLTWVFPVDAGFTYMLRLHFCELDPAITDTGDRVFFIYVAGKVAEDHADVMKWSSNQKGVAVQRNYAVIIPKNDDNHKKVNLSLQMHPYGEYKDTTYSDPFLNGLEIFKISDLASNNLAGSNPDLVQALPNLQLPSTGKKTQQLNNCYRGFFYCISVCFCFNFKSTFGPHDFELCKMSP